MSYTWNPISGQLDIVRPKPQSVKKVIESYTAGETLSALTLVRSNGTSVVKANPDTITNSEVLGLAITAAASGNQVNVLIFGTLEDASFSSFNLNKSIYLSDNGVMSQTIPVLPASNYQVLVGKYLGSDTIFLSIEDSIQL